MTSASKSQELLNRQTVSKQDTTAGSRTYNQMEPVLLSGIISEKYEPQVRKIDVASTLLARDYKGFNNYGNNGVLECKKIT